MHYKNTSSFCKGFKTLFLLFFLFSSSITFGQKPANAGQSPAGNVSPGDIQIDQISNQQASDFYNRARAAGMSDGDIQRAALQRGYSQDQIDLMFKKVKNSDKNTGQEDQQKERSTNDPREQQDQDELDDDITSERDTSAAGQLKKLNRENQIFGSSFFRKSSSTFEPNLRIATPTNYILGPEDELTVDIYGNSIDNFQLKVSPEGTVKMLNLAPVYVNGLTIEQAESKILGRLRQAYSNLNRPGSGTYFTLSLGNVRSIKVMVTGEVLKPGTYTVSSLATAFNALYVTGGPTRNGSFRDIEIIRNNKVIRKIDLYNFLVDADMKDNIGLRDQDIILVRPYKKRVQLLGELKRVGFFEATDDDSVEDLIRYAGGFNTVALTNSINFQRNTGKNYIIGSIPDSLFSSSKPQNGDIFRVGMILETITNQIEVKGAVTRPGIYPLEDNCNTVLELLTRADGVSPRAFMNRATLERSGGPGPVGLVAIDLTKLLNHEIEDIPLVPGDVLSIKSVDELREPAFLTIAGSVISPGNFPYFNNITIPDLVFQAGGLREGGIPYRIEVSRRIKNDTIGIPETQNVKIYTLNIDENLKVTSEDESFSLQPYDIVLVRFSPRYELQKIVTVLGAVTYPGAYTILNNFERISDLLPKVGGLKPEANLSGARFYRSSELVAIDLEAVSKNPSLQSNLLLMNGDSLTIPTALETVRINGGVFNPSVVNFDNNFSFKDYISQAGGYMEGAWKNRIYVTYPNGRTHRTGKFLFFRSYPTVHPGSVISVPIKAAKIDRTMSPGERIAIFSLIASVLSTVALTIVRLQ